MAVLEDGPGIWVLLGQGRSRYLRLPLPRDTHLACPCGHMSPAGHLPVTISQGLCSAFSSSLKWKHFKGLCFFFFPPSPFCFSLQTINYKFKRKFQPSFATQRFRGSKYKAVQRRNKTLHPVLSEVKAVVVWRLFGFFTSFLESSVS